ncbi:hypothetical protein VP01_542g3 [Puccinia sorghi]|uniref:Uncharacterized protein n=1 Tax=Puccinia sorghi TaxID=27349 RepID=A0A0L6UJN1_9BASI|nr:hypothetical protein VP01_542g3 [Puccinia sorghi]
MKNNLIFKQFDPQLTLAAWVLKMKPIPGAGGTSGGSHLQHQYIYISLLQASSTPLKSTYHFNPSYDLEPLVNISKSLLSRLVIKMGWDKMFEFHSVGRCFIFILIHPISSYVNLERLESLNSAIFIFAFKLQASSTISCCLFHEIQHFWALKEVMDLMNKQSNHPYISTHFLTYLNGWLDKESEFSWMNSYKHPSFFLSLEPNTFHVLCKVFIMTTPFFWWIFFCAAAFCLVTLLKHLVSRHSLALQKEVNLTLNDFTASDQFNQYGYCGRFFPPGAVASTGRNSTGGGVASRKYGKADVAPDGQTSDRIFQPRHASWFAQQLRSGHTWMQPTQHPTNRSQQRRVVLHWLVSQLFSCCSFLSILYPRSIAARQQLSQHVFSRYINHPRPSQAGQPSPIHISSAPSFLPSNFLLALSLKLSRVSYYFLSNTLASISSLSTTITQPISLYLTSGFILLLLVSLFSPYTPSIQIFFLIVIFSFLVPINADRCKLHRDSRGRSLAMDGQGAAGTYEENRLTGATMTQFRASQEARDRAQRTNRTDGQAAANLPTGPAEQAGAPAPREGTPAGHGRPQTNQPAPTPQQQALLRAVDLLRNPPQPQPARHPRILALIRGGDAQPSRGLGSPPRPPQIARGLLARRSLRAFVPLPRPPRRNRRTRPMGEARLRRLQALRDPFIRLTRKHPATDRSRFLYPTISAFLSFLPLSSSFMKSPNARLSFSSRYCLKFVPFSKMSEPHELRSLGCELPAALHDTYAPPVSLSAPNHKEGAIRINGEARTLCSPLASEEDGFFFVLDIDQALRHKRKPATGLHMERRWLKTMKALDEVTGETPIECYVGMTSALASSAHSTLQPAWWKSRVRRVSPSLSLCTSHRHKTCVCDFHFLSLVSLNNMSLPSYQTPFLLYPPDYSFLPPPSGPCI